jgi:hypothetical protein
MKIRATLLSIAKVSVVVTAAGACAGTPNKIMADTPVLPYQEPDIEEITGIDEPDEEEEEESEAPAAAPAPAPAPAAATPAPAAQAPAKTAAKPAAKAPAKAPAPAPAKK